MCYEKFPAEFNLALHSAQLRSHTKRVLIRVQEKNIKLSSSLFNLKVPNGRGGSASGRAMAFCPSRPGSNPGTNFGFFGSDCHSILAGRWAFSIKEVIE